MSSNVSIVLPAYNEEENIEDAVNGVVTALESLGGSYEVIVVNDGSKDNTGKIADELAEKNKNVRVIHHFPNKGYANAIKSGFEHARYELVFYTDSDNQFDLNEIKKLLCNIEDADIVIGYRIGRQDNFLRLIVSRAYNFMVRSIFRLKVRDIDCAFKLFRRSVFNKIAINSNGFLFDTEILVKARKEGLRVKEIGVSHLPRLKGHSTVSPSDVFTTLKGLSLLWLGIFKINWTKLILGLAVSVFFVVLVTRNIDVREIKTIIKSVDLFYIVPALTAYGVSFVVRSYRWQILLKPSGEFKLSQLFSGIMVGWMGNNILPLRMGEFVRAYDFGNKHSLSKSLTFSTIVVERVLDGIAIVSLLSVVMLFYEFPLWINRIYVIGVFFFFIAFIFLFYLIFGRDTSGESVIFDSLDKLSKKYLKPLEFKVVSFLQGLEILLKEKYIFAALILSMFVWLCEGGVYYFFIKAFEMNLPYYAPILILGIVNLGLIVPSIGYVGTFQFFCISALQHFSVNGSEALGFSIALHATLYIPITILGLIFFVRNNFEKIIT